MFRMILRRFMGEVFDPLFDFYYKYGSYVPPFRYYLKGFLHLSEEDVGYAIKYYEKDYDPTCFPFPFKLNCIGCFGCLHNQNPLFHPKRHKGPWKVMLADTFKERYTEMFGKEALFDLMWDLEKHNQKVDNLKNEEAEF